MKWVIEIAAIVALTAAVGSGYIASTGKLEFFTHEVEVAKLNRDNAACGKPADVVVIPEAGSQSQQGDTGDPSASPGVEPKKDPVAEDPNKIPHINLEEALESWTDGLVFVDARASKYYAEGHIPGAYSIPAHEPGKEDQIQTITEQFGTSTPVIVYCNESTECEDSHIVGEIMRDGFGFEAIQVYEGGFPGWVKAKKPYSVGSEPGSVETAIQPTDERYGKMGGE